jgi:polycomb protein EED
MQELVVLTTSSVRWFDDLILSHAVREEKIVLWRIDGFSSNRTTPPAPVPVSSALRSTTQVIVAAHSASSTRSAWGGRFQRLLQFELPQTNIFYMRFNIFHQMGRHPILVAGNEKSKVFFWDLQRLEESDTGDSASRVLPAHVARHIREGSSTSNASSATSAGSGASKLKVKKAREPLYDGGIGDPFRPIRAHKAVEVLRKGPAIRQFDWSTDGQWCVGTGDEGLIHVFSRWETGVPPIKTDLDTDVQISCR